MYKTIGSSEYEWGGQTYREISNLAHRDGSILVVPTGSLEQHGHHLPVATDTILSEAAAHHGIELIADDLPVLVTPPIWTGHSPHHLGFGGTITVEYGRFIALLDDIADSAVTLGFDSVLLVNGHGGNIPLVGTAVSDLGQRHLEVLIAGITYYQLAAPYIDEIRDSDIGGMAHGGEFETSLMLHFRPDLVRDDRMEGTEFEDPLEYRGQDLFDSGPLSVYRPFEAYSSSGAIGDPTAATAEKGEILCEIIAEELSELLSQLYAELTEVA